MESEQMIQNITAGATQKPALQAGAQATKRYSRLGVLALLVAHCAGMVDLVALPVWVGTLIGDYHLDPQQAGSLATLFLAGAVASSVFLSPRLNRLRARLIGWLRCRSRCVCRHRGSRSL
jgi:apolipoprotein N-acyltransferase